MIDIDADLSELGDAADEHCDLVAFRPGPRRADLGADKVLGRVAPTGGDEEARLLVEYLEIPKHLQRFVEVYNN